VFLDLFVFDCVSSVLTKRFAGKNISKMTYFCVDCNVKP